MKKALAILLALSMVFAAFADEPATNYSVAEFSGEASLEYVYDLEKEESGFKNSDKATLKLNLLNGGNKATSGDGIWGELEIKIDTPDALENPGALSIGKTASVEKAKIHFVDGDYGVALNLKKPGLNLGEVVLPTAVGADLKSSKFDVADFAPAAAKADIDAAQAKVDQEQAKYDQAKLQDLIAGTDTASDADLKAAKEALAALKDDSASLKAGFAVEFTSPAFDATVKVLDNGVAANKAKEYGFGADVSVKVIENAGLKAGFAYAYEKTAFAASADYKLAIDDAMYVKPAVAFGMKDETKELAIGALFGWGADGQEPNFIENKNLPKVDGNYVRYVPNKCADGVSVTYTSSLEENDKGHITIGLYDSTLVEGLKVGAYYDVVSLDDFGEGYASLAAKYGTDIDIVTIGLDFGLATMLGTDDSTVFDYAVEVSTDDVIDNTTVYAKWTDAGKDKDGKITVGAKIAL